MVYLCFDVGGTGLKAALVDESGKMIGERIRIPTPYPLDPSRLIKSLKDMTAHLKGYERVAMGFPGLVREGRILTAPHFVLKNGPGSDPDPDLEKAWANFEMASALAEAFGVEARVANDADVAGSAVIEGTGLELVVTLGTGFGTGLFYRGRLMPHLEIAHHPFAEGQTYNEQLGERARKEIGNARWRERVARALKTLFVLMHYDRVYVGGGNAKHVKKEDLPENALVVTNDAGLVGGVSLWKRLHEP